MGGVSVAAGDVNNDGKADIVTGAGPGGGPHVRVISGATGGELAGYFAYDPAFAGGIVVTAGDLDQDGTVDVITAPGVSGGPHVAVFSGVDGHLLASFMAFSGGGGAFVGANAERPLRFISPSSTSFLAGTPGTFTVETAGQPAPAMTATGTLPTGVTFVDNGDGTATLAGTPATGTGGTYALTFTATGTGAPVTQSFTLTVNQNVAITSASATTMTLGAAGSFAITTTGFPVPTLTLGGAALPAGVTFVDNGNGTGTLSGTPAVGTGGTYALTFTASNGVGAAAVQNFTLTVSGAPTFTSASTTTFTVGSAGTFTVTTVATPTASMNVTGTLPAGVTFVDNGGGTGTLSGTPAAGTAGVYALTFTASNGVLPNGTQAFTLNVNGGPVITSAASATFSIGAAGSFTVTASGFPLPTLAIGGVALPAGVAFTDNGNGTGTLSGTPAAGTGGTYAISFTATNTVGSSAPQAFTLTVNGAPSITSASTTTFTVGTPGTFTITAIGSPTPALSVAGSLPAGVTFLDNGNGTGTLSGTPAAGTGGAYAMTFTASNGVLPNGIQSFTLNVNGAPAITSAASTTFTVGTAGSFTVTTTGFPVPTLSIGGVALPAGVAFADNGNGTGTLSGTPAAGTGGTYAISFTATNTAGSSAPQAFTLTVNQAPAITSANSTSFVVGTAGSFTVTTTGFPTPAITRTGAALPGGVTFTDNGNGTGTLSGTLAAGTAGSYAFTFTAANGALPNAVQAFTLNAQQPPAITSATSTTFTVGTPGTFTVTTTGFPTPTVSQTGTLPNGITFTPATRVLGGTATQTGAFPLVFTASNGIPPDATQNFTLNVVCPAITVTPLVMPDGLFQTAYAGVDFNQTGSTGASFTWGAAGLPAGLAIDAGTGVISGTPTDTVLNAPVTVTVTDNFGCVGTVNTTLTIRPTTDNENYTGGVGNTQYVVGAAVPSTPHVLNADLTNTNVKMGDNGPGTLTVAFPATSSNLGVIVEGSTDGTFTYTPAVGFAGSSDSFTYTLTDGNGVTNTATVTINLSNMVWYVNSAGGNGDGRSHNPFNTLADAATPSLTNQTIYVHSGGATTSGNLAMDANQTLHGQGATFSLNGLTILAGARPTLTGTVTLANNTAVTAVNFTPSAIPAMTASGLTQAVAIDQVNVTGGTSALSLTNVSGAVTVTNANFTHTSAAEVLINQGAGTVSVAAVISSNAGRSVDIQNRTGGTVTFTGSITDTGQGIFLNANTGSTINFTGGLALTTTTNPGFTATGGGTVSATQNNTTVVNTITTTTGTALNVANTTIGVGGLTFRSISANGAANGVVLNNTGTTAGLTVTGNAGTCTSAGTCTGGAIQNTTSDGLALTTTRTVSLTRLFVGTAANHGINANAVNGLTLSNSFVQDNGNGDNEHGLNLVNAAETVTIDATTFSGASEDLVHLENNNTNVTFTVTNSSQFTYPTSIGGFANSAILLLPGGTAAITASIQSSTFTNIRGVAAQIGANLINSTGTQNFTFSNNTINVTIAGRASGVVVGGQELTITNITIANNNFSGAGGNGVISIDTNDSSRVEGTVSGNQITNPPGIGMFVAVDEAATNDIVFDNNTITNSGGDGIQAVNFGGAGISTMQLAVTNNVVNGHSANTAVNFVGGISFTGFEDTSCLVLRGNTVTGTPAGATQCGGAPCVDYYLEEVGGTMTLEEVPNTAATTASAAYVNSINDAGPVTIFGTIDLTNGATCNVALMADGGEGPACGTASAVEQDDLTRLVLAAARSMDAGAPGARDRASIATDPIASLGLRLTDLAAGQLGRVAGRHISLDRDAAGWGWFVDPTPDQDEEFEPPSPGTGGRRAKAGGPADGKMDLLTVLMHEMGHARGDTDLDSVAHPGELMAAKLRVGVRRRAPPVK